MTPPAYHTNPEYRAHLAGIRANPDDDLPRLVLADWLEEHGHGERGKWVRYGIAFEQTLCNLPRRLGETPYTKAGEGFCNNTRCRHCGLYRDCSRLADAAVGRNYFVDPWHLETRRGFITEFTGEFLEWVEHADRILPESVGLTVRLTDHPGLEMRGVPGESERTIRIRSGEFKSPWVWATNWDTKQELHKLWPDVARWELPPEQNSIIWDNGVHHPVITHFSLHTSD